MKQIKNAVHNVARKIKKDNENGARKAVIEDMFYDFNRSRAEVYKMNFARGVFFGFGTVIGGTIVVALIIWILSVFVNIFPPLADFINNLITTMQSRSN